MRGLSPTVYWLVPKFCRECLVVGKFIISNFVLFSKLLMSIVSWTVTSRIRFNTITYSSIFLFTNTENIFRGLIIVSCVMPLLSNSFFNLHVDRQIFYDLQIHKQTKEYIFQLRRVCSKAEEWLWLTAYLMTRIHIIARMMTTTITFYQLLINLMTKSYVGSLTDSTKSLIFVSMEEETSEKWLLMIWTSDKTFREYFDSG